MFNLHLIVLGKYKETHWKNAEEEYLKRLKPYAKIRITEISEEAFHDINERDSIQLREAEKIKKYLTPGSIVIACHERGKEFDSIMFAKLLEEKSQHGDEITIIIGGPLGLHPSLLKEVSLQLSLSKLTFPHQLVRIILLEQLYRAGTITTHKQYHY